MERPKYWVYDLETLVNCFMGVFESYTSEERHVFIISEERNDISLLIEFLKECQTNGEWLFGYNNLAFDAQIIEYILKNDKRLLKYDNIGLLKDLYEYAQDVISKSNKREFADFPEWKLTINQLDIYKLNHWDGDAKRTSLKWVQYSMDWHNVEEMPYHHTKKLNGIKEVTKVLKYCINDVKSTKAIFSLPDMKKQINIRSTLSATYDLKLHSASEPKISRDIFLHFLSEKLNVSKKFLKELRTHRDYVKIKDIILPIIHFDSPEFKKMFNWFLSLNVEITDGKIVGPKHTVIHKGVKTDYGLGGLHGCISPGIYESTEDTIIVTADVESFYPNLAIKNKWSPAHIPKESFCDLYQWFFEERKKYDKKNPLNYLFKIILNSTYGLSKEKHSFLYDPELTFRITVNGQLLLTMLYEKISLAIPDAIPIMQNTDGLEFIIRKDQLELFNKVCADWESLTKLRLEVDTYKKMIIRDVNNYIAIYNDPKKKPKCKGIFEWEDLPLHKNKSFLVITKAIYNYFVNGITPEDYLKSNTNIFDYCGGVKIKGDWYFVQKHLVNGVYKEEKLQKLVRYYVANKGVKLSKKHPDGRDIQIEAGAWMQKLFNKFVEMPFEEYGINTKYYLDKIYQEIHNIKMQESKQININF